MYPWSHFLFPLFIAEIFVKLNILNHYGAILAGLIGLSVDIDHFIGYVIHHRDLNLKHAWNADVVKHENERTFIHRETGLIFITLPIILLFFLNKIVFLIISLGYYTHIFLDNLNISISKKIFKIKEKGFVIKLPFYELIFDILLVVGILLLIF